MLIFSDYLNGLEFKAAGLFESKADLDWLTGGREDYFVEGLLVAYKL